MWEILSSPDFKTNLLAGAVFFVLEALLIVGLLSYFIQRRLDGRWAKSRLHLCHHLSEKWIAFRRTAADIGDTADDESWAKLARSFERIEKDIAQVIQTFSAALDPELMKCAASLLRTAQVLELNCSYLVSTPMGSVGIAVADFSGGASELGKMYAHLGCANQNPFDWGAEEEQFEKALNKMVAAVWGEKEVVAAH